MNLSDIKIRVKRSFGDEAQVQITDSDITRWVNDAQRYIVSNNEGVLQKAVTADIVADQQEYTVPTDLFVLRSVSIKTESLNTYYPLQGTNQADFNALFDGWEANTLTRGAPGYYHKFSNIIKLYPIPLQSVAAGLKIYYNRYPVDLTVDAQEIDLPTAYHTIVLDYVMQQAYELDEDWKAVEAKQSQVELGMHRNKGREDRQPSITYQTITTLPEDI